MSDFEAEQTTPGRAAPSVAFDRAMAGVDTRCSDLTAVLDSGDLDRVEHVVRSAVNLWLTGRSAYRRLVERERSTSPHVTAARQCLNAAYVRLLDVLGHAYARAGDHTTRSHLDDVRIELITAAAQPITDGKAAVEAKRTDDTQDMDIDD
jgi:hypothetical protein